MSERKANDQSLGDFLPQGSLYIPEFGPHSIVVDTSDQRESHEYAQRVLDAGGSFVTANKFVTAASTDAFCAIRHSLEQSDGTMRASSVVGAGLPVLETLASEHRAGRRVERVQGLMSGTISFIATALQRGQTLRDAADDAARRGLAEPDPWQDLSGNDQKRKALTIARVLGWRETIDEFEPFADREEGFEAAEARLLEADRIASSSNMRHVYLTTIRPTGTSIRFVQVPAKNPLARWDTCENVFAITLQEQQCPIVIQGLGAGTTPTARGVLWDVATVTAGGPGHF